jgi:hypothetical protein
VFDAAHLLPCAYCRSGNTSSLLVTTCLTPSAAAPTAAAAASGSITGGRKWHLGREWDHVFDVEMDSGAKLKLALDVGENPYIVADRFLEQHDLPAEFKEQVRAACGFEYVVCLRRALK